LDGLGLAHKAPQAMHGIDQTLVAKQHDRLPSRATRDAVLGRQLVLAGQQITRLVDPVADRRAQQISDLLVHRPIGLGINHPSQNNTLLCRSSLDKSTP
jgi:hypothetical protein